MLRPGHAIRGAARLAVLAALSIAACGIASAQSFSRIPSGDSHQVASVSGTDLDVFTYRPTGCEPRALLLVFHGVKRNAADYRDHAKPLADRACAIVIAPTFDRERFPTDLYQYGGVIREASGRRTVDLVPPLVVWARRAAEAPNLPVILLGHSAGAQFLGRVAAFVPDGGGVSGIILANPSTWVEPTLSTPAPFGLGDTETATDAGLRAYLAQPITVLLGGADTGTAYLAMSPAAMAQGPNRRARGLNAFKMAETVAQAHGWPFRWTLAEVPGVGHDASAMFASRQAFEAVMRAGVAVR